MPAAERKREIGNVELTNHRLFPANRPDTGIAPGPERVLTWIR
jgi:hypothetical protein